jgi:hypothetical protein
MSDTQTKDQNTPVETDDIQPLIEEEPVVVELGGLDDDEEEGTFTIKLEGSDDVVLSKSLISISKLIETSLESALSSGDEELVVVLATNGKNDDKSDSINAKQLALICEYMNLCKTLNNSKDVTKPPQPLTSKNLMDSVCDGLPKEIIEYVNSIRDRDGNNLNTVYNLISVSNYLDIQGLLYLLCAYMAAQMKGLPMENVEKILDPLNKTNGDFKASE